MFISILWVVLRSIVIPYLAFEVLRDTALGDKGALLAVGIALFISTAISLFWNAIKIIGNTLLLRGHAIIVLLLKVTIQVLALLSIWGYYLKEYTDVLDGVVT